MSGRGVRAAASWHGSAWFGPWWLVYRGPVGVTAEHAHHALQAVYDSRVQIDVCGVTRRAPTSVAPNEAHRISRGADDATLVYVDGDVVRSRRACPPSAWSAIPAPRSWTDARALAEAICPPGAPVEEPFAVRRARLALADTDDVRRIDQIAADTGMSVSRLSHVFTEVVGTSMRSYRRWQRLLVAAEAIAGGSSLTAAAHASGFADGPHLARTFRRHFGLSVTELTTAIHFVSA